MILKDTENQEILVGTTKEMNFTIDTESNIIFKILRDKMYTNKIGAICREVSSNSRDANREAGLGDQPIEIEFTTTNNIYNVGDVCIIFRDFGKGIDPDRMENIFMKYAASTKRSSNAQTGGFGLGAKTPFAYTDSFIIKTVCIVDGEKWEYTYNAIIDRSGKGKMIQLDEKKTDKNTGTEIIVPIVSSSDRHEFEKECYRSTMYWENVNYINFQNTKPVVEYLMKEEGFSIVRSSERIFSTPYIGLLDSIPYPIEPSKAFKGLGDNYHILFDLEVENVTINANRESIQNDAETTEYLNEKVEVVIENLKEKVDTYLKTHSNLKEALLKYSHIKEYSTYVTYSLLEEIILACKARYTSDRLLSGHDFRVVCNDRVINGTLGLKQHRILKVFNTSLTEDSETGKITSCKFDYNKVEQLTSRLLSVPIVRMDRMSHNASKQLSILERSPLNFFVLLKPVKNADPDLLQKDIDFLKEVNFEHEVYSELKTPKIKIQRPKLDRSKVRFKYRSTYNLTSASDELVLDKADGLLYEYGKKVPYKKRRIALYIVDNISDALNYERTGVQYYGKFLKVIKRVEKVYVVKKSVYEKHLKEFNYKTVNEIFNTLDKSYLVELKKKAQVVNLFDKQISEFIWKNFPELLPKSGKDLLSLYKEVKDEVDSDLSKFYWNGLGLKKTSFDFEGFLYKHAKNMSYKYPMLESYISNLNYTIRYNYNPESNNHKRVINNIKNYIKSV